ncbi:helix-turn-helix transcriptional regulator [Deltaproteobacteria bacterium IMCC39524]|nr:helix-turn-helix transcriptional regulator [Deltaproteobacteria bacterium IMCC39524]
MGYQGSCRRYRMVGQQLKNARHKINLHPSVIASFLGYTDPSIIFNIENGDVRVPLKDLPQLAKVLKLPLYRLHIIVEGYYPGFSSKASEIVGKTIEPLPEDKFSVAIVLSAIEQQSQIM